MRLFRAWESFWGLLGLVRRNRRQRKAARSRRRSMRRHHRMEALEPRVVLNADPVAQDDIHTLEVPYGSGWQTVDVSGFQPDLGNDSDPDNDVLSLDTNGNPGSAYTAPGQTVSYGYTISDGNGGYGGATVQINIVEAAPPSNGGPTAGDDNYTLTIPYGSNPYWTDLSSFQPDLGNDTDPENDGLSITANGNPGWTYVYAGNTVSYGYTVTDGNWNYSSASVNISIVEEAPPPTNNSPWANDATFELTIPQGGAGGTYDLSGYVPQFGTHYGDPDLGDSLTVSYTGYGYTSVWPGQQYSYSYSVDDGRGGQASANVYINIVEEASPPNYAPTANDDSYTVYAPYGSGGIEINWSDYQPNVGNDTDPENDGLTLLTSNNPGGYQWVGVGSSASYSYTIDDGHWNQATGNVTVSVVEAANNAPVLSPSLVDPALPGIDEDTGATSNYGTLVRQLIDPNLYPYAFDLDGHPLGIAVVGADNSNGVWEYSLDGNIWSQLPQVGDGSALLLAADDYASLRFLPHADYHGAATISFRLWDRTDGYSNGATGVNVANNGGSSAYSAETDTATITVAPVNDAPWANSWDDAFPVNHNDPGQFIGVPGHIYGDIDNDQSQLTVQQDQLLLEPGQFGTITYTVTDPSGLSASGSVTLLLEVLPNQFPTAGDDHVDVNEDEPKILNVLTNDGDPDGDTLTPSILGDGPTNGTAVVNPDGTITYSPDPDFHGEDSFTYQIDDGWGGWTTATVFITVQPVNDAPFPYHIGTLTLAEDTSVLIDVAALVADTTDVDGGPPSFAGFGSPSHGTITDHGDGTYSYAPAANYHGPDSVAYYISDGELVGEGTLNIEVTPVNDAPVAADDVLTTGVGTTLNFGQLALTGDDADVDGDDLNVASLVGHPAHGSVTWHADGSFTYTSEPGFVGLDSFRYDVTDGALESRATVWVEVGPPVVVAVSDAVTLATAEDTPLELRLTRNREAGAAAPYYRLTVSDGTLSAGSQSGAAIVVAALTNFTFTPASNAHGPVTLAVEPGQMVGETFVANRTTVDPLTITVAPFNDAPTTGVNTGRTLSEGATVVIDGTHLRTDDVDNATGQRIYTLTTLTAHGALRLDGVALNVGGTFTQADLDSGKLSYTHDSSENFTDSFQFTVSDGQYDLPVATFNLTITPVNDAPTVALNTGLTLPEGATVVIDGTHLGTDDVDNSTVQRIYTLTALTAHGALQLDGVALAGGGTFTQADLDAGKVTYVHNSTENFTDSFKFTVSDGEYTLPEATFNLTITPVNDGPTTGVNTGRTLAEGAAVVIDGTHLRTDDVDTAAAQRVYTLTAVTAHGMLKLDGAILSVGGTFTQADLDIGKLTYAHDSGESLGDSFAFTVGDGEFTLPEATFALTITPVNDGLTAGLNTGRTLAEGATVVIDGTHLRTDDVDTAAAQRVYTLTAVTARGALKLDGATLSVGGTFTQADLNAGKLTYTHDSSENFADSFNFTVSDGEYALPEANFTLNITPVNDAPTVGLNTGRTLSEGATVVIDGTHLRTDDVDTAAIQRVYTLTALTAHGALKLDGATLNVGDTFTQADLDAGKLTYAHDSSENFNDLFAFTVGDGEFTLPEATFSLTIAPVNDGPTAGLNTGRTLAEGATVVIDGTHLRTDDVDSPAAQRVYTLTALTAHGALKLDGAILSVGGTFAQADLDAGKLSYTHDSTENLVDSLSFTVSDGDVALPEATFNLTITPVNDTPMAGLNTGRTLAEGASVVIDGTHLRTDDLDTAAAQRVYTLTTLTTHGALTLDSVSLTVGGTFTQADLDSGKLSYTHDSSENFTDDFKFTVSDGEFTLPEATFALNITPVNDAPTVGLNTGRTLAEGATVVIDGTHLRTDDVDTAAAQRVYTLTALTVHGALKLDGATLSVGGTFSQADLDAGKLTYTHDSGENFADSYVFTVGDGEFTHPQAAFVLTITPVNDGPTLQVPAGLTVTAPASLNLLQTGISIGDVDAGTEPVELSLSALAGTLTATTGAGGVVVTVIEDTVTLRGTIAQLNDFLAGSGGGTLSYVAATQQASTDTLSIVVSDLGNSGAGGALTAGGSIAITVQAPPNNAPSLNLALGGPSLYPIPQDSATNGGTAVADLVSDSLWPGFYSDPDAGNARGIAVTGAFGTEGVWEYSLDDGLTWNPVVPVVGTLSEEHALLLPADPGMRIRFEGDAATWPTTPFITFRAWDQTSGVAGQYVDPVEYDSVGAETCEAVQVFVQLPEFQGSVYDFDMPPIAVREAAGTDGYAGDSIFNLLFDELGGYVEGVAVSGVDNAQGTWEYQVADDPTWHGFGTVTEGAALLLDLDTSVRFVPNVGGAPVVVDQGLSFRLWNGSYGYAGGRVSVADGENVYLGAEELSLSVDVRPAVRIEDATFLESAGSSGFTVTLSHALSADLTIKWRDVDGTATMAGDRADFFMMSRNVSWTTTTIAAGDTTAFVPVSMVMDDAFDEADEEFTVEIEFDDPSESRAVIARNSAVGTILDNDQSPEVSVSETYGSEAEGYVEFVVHLSVQSEREITVDWTTVDGTAVSTGPLADFVADFGTLTFLPGEQDKVVRVVVRKDELAEPGSEAFQLVLSNPVNATLGAGQAAAAANITDMMTTPKLRISDAYVQPGETEARFMVSLTAPPAEGTSVVVELEAMTDTLSGQYVSNYQLSPLTFTAGQTHQYVTVPISTADRTQIGHFILRATSVTNALVVDGIAVGTVSDKYHPRVGLADLRVDAAAGIAYVTLAAQNVVSTQGLPFEIDYSVAPGSNVATVSGTVSGGSDVVLEIPLLGAVADWANTTFGIQFNIRAGCPLVMSMAIPLPGDPANDDPAEKEGDRQGEDGSDDENDCGCFPDNGLRHEIDQGTGQLRLTIPSFGALDLNFRSTPSVDPIIRQTTPILYNSGPVSGRVDLIKVEAGFDGGPTRTTYYRADNLPGNGAEAMLAASLDSSGLATGMHAWTMTVTEYRAGQESVRTFTGERAVVERDYDELGEGWAPALTRLYATGGGVLVVYGIGTAAFFRDDGGVYATPVGESATLVQVDADLDGNPDGYELSYVNGTKEQFALDGRITQKTDRNGNTTTYLYDGQQRLYRVATTTGLLTQLTYNGTTGKLQSIAELNADQSVRRSLGFGFTADRLTSVLLSDPDGAGTATPPEYGFEYDTAGNLTRRIDPTGESSQFEYDVAGRVARSTTATGKVYDRISSRTVLLGSSDLAKPNYLKAPDELVAARSDGHGGQISYSVDRYGNLLEVVNPDGTHTLYERNDDGRIVTVTEIVGELDAAGGTNDDRVTSYEYVNGRRTAATYPDGRRDEWDYLYGTDLVTEQRVLEDWTVVRRTSYTYDPVNYNNLIEVREHADPAGGGLTTDDVVTVYEYTTAATAGTLPLGLLTKQIEAFGSAEETTTVYEYYADVNDSASFGKLQRVTRAFGEPEAQVTEYEYEFIAGGREEREIRVVGNRDDAGNGEVDDVVTRTVYDFLERVVDRYDALGRRTHYVYDAAGRQIKSIEVIGDLDTPANNEHDDLVSQTVYNAAGDVEQTIGVDPDGVGTDYAAPVTTYTYYADGNLHTVTDPRGQVTTYEYVDNRLTKATTADPDGASGPLGQAQTERVYDSLGRVERVIRWEVQGATRTLLSQTQNIYDDHNRLWKSIDALNRVTEYEYDSADRLMRTYLPNFDVQENVYDVLGRLRETWYYVGGLGSPIRSGTIYGYDAFGRQTTVTQVVGEVDDPNYPNPVDPADIITTTEFDQLGRMTATVDPLGRRREQVYDHLGQLKESRQVIGLPDASSGETNDVVTTYEYDALGNLRRQYDPDPDRIDAVTDGAGLSPLTKYEYDKSGRVTKTTQVVGNEDDANDDGVLDGAENDDVVTRTTYDFAGRALTQTDPRGNVTTNVYHDDGSLKSTTDALGNVVQYTYAADGSGLLTSVEDQRGYVTSYEYDELGRQTKVSQPHLPAVAPSAYVSQVEYDAAGRVRQQTDALNRRTEFTYDTAGRVTQVTVIDGVADATPGRPGDDPNDVVATYTYESDSDRVTIVDDPIQGAKQTEYLDDLRTYREYVRVAGTWQLVRTTVLDELGRVQSVTVAGSESAPGTVVTPASTTTYSYAADGQLLSQTTTDALGVVKSRTDFVYDPDTGRPTETIQVAGERDDDVNADGDPNNDEDDDLVSTVAYDQLGRVIAQVDPLNHATLTSYDRLGRVLSQTDAESGVTTFHYDQASNRTDLTDPVGNNTHWTYDALNRVDTETQQDAYQGTDLAGRSFLYDEAGHVLRRTDRNGRVIDYVYDASGRRTLEYWFAAGQAPTTPVAAGGATSNALHTIASLYDDAGRLLEIIDWDGLAPTNPAWAAGALSGYEYEYDRFDRPTRITVRQADQPDVVLTQTYDDRSRRQSLAVQIGSTADFTNTYHYDSYDRLHLVDQAGDPAGNAVAAKWAAFGYNEFGQFGSVLRGTGIAPVVASSFQYDAYGRLQNLSHTLGSGAAAGGGNEVAGYGYAYDAAGRITGIAFAQRAAESATYNHDATNQLTGADRAGTADDEAYDYDANGNRDSAGYVTDAHNRTTEDAEFLYGYDAEGNRTGKTRKSSDPADDHAVTYSWDNRNRLSAVEFRDNGGALTKRVDYQYDAFDHLLGRTVTIGASVTTTRFVYDGNQIVLEFQGAAGTTLDLVRRYLWGTSVDQLLAQENFDATNNTSAVLWMLTDHLNTVRDVLGADGTVVAHFAYDSFGKLSAAVDGGGAAIANVSAVTTYLYTARWFDVDAGLQNNWRRWFDPSLGKWISEDPIGFDGGLTLLNGYVGNDPLYKVDPTGLAPPATPEDRSQLSHAQLIQEWQARLDAEDKEHSQYAYYEGLKVDQFFKKLRSATRTQIKAIYENAIPASAQKAATYRMESIKLVATIPQTNILTIVHETVHAYDDMMDINDGWFRMSPDHAEGMAHAAEYSITALNHIQDFQNAVNYILERYNAQKTPYATHKEAAKGICDAWDDLLRKKLPSTRRGKIVEGTSIFGASRPVEGRDFILLGSTMKMWAYDEQKLSEIYTEYLTSKKFEVHKGMLWYTDR